MAHQMVAGGGQRHAPFDRQRFDPGGQGGLHLGLARRRAVLHQQKKLHLKIRARCEGLIQRRNHALQMFGTATLRSLVVKR